MADGNWWIEIVFLAMLAGFIGLRLVNVLGRRTGHENTAGDLVRPRQGPAGELQPSGAGFGEARTPAAVTLPVDTAPHLRDPLQAIADADGHFEPTQFLEGAKAAYRMILEAFWAADIEGLERFVSDDVALQFRRSVEAREAEGLRLENRLVRIERAQIVSAQMHGMMAEITVRFDADIVAVTRDSDGEVVGGSTSDALQTHDIWTFSRHVTASDPNWLLIATDDEG